MSSADEALGIKAVDYIAFAPKIDVNQAYQWLSQSVNAVKAESAAATIFYFLQMSLDKLKTDPNHKEQFIQDYLAASEYADAAIAAETNEAKKKNLQGIKDNLVALFVNSGTADCESLQNILWTESRSFNQRDPGLLEESNRHHENDEMYGKRSLSTGCFLCVQDRSRVQMPLLPDVLTKHLRKVTSTVLSNSSTKPLDWKLTT